MQDAISNVVNKYDLAGKYLDRIALKELNNYFNTGLDRILASEIINSKASIIVKETAAQLYEEQPELLRPGGNSYTTRRYAACLRDIEYYLRYCSYAIIAGDMKILNERVLDGLRETYNSLNVPIGPTVRSIKILENTISDIINANNTSKQAASIISEPFQHLIDNLSEKNI